MRRVRDRDLPEPFRSWIDREVPLPLNVTILPRTISITGDALAVAIILMGCVGFGTPIATIVPRSDPGAGGWAVAGSILAILAAALVWRLHRLGVTIVARRERKAGRLRMGVLVGPEGMLVRMRPGRGYLVAKGRFVKAEAWSGGGENGSDYLRIVTRDGLIDLDDADLAADAADINRAVAAAGKR